MVHRYSLVPPYDNRGPYSPEMAALVNNVTWTAGKRHMFFWWATSMAKEHSASISGQLVNLLQTIPAVSTEIVTTLKIGHLSMILVDLLVETVQIWQYHKDFPVSPY